MIDDGERQGVALDPSRNVEQPAPDLPIFGGRLRQNAARLALDRGQERRKLRVGRAPGAEVFSGRGAGDRTGVRRTEPSEFEPGFETRSAGRRRRLRPTAGKSRNQDQCRKWYRREVWNSHLDGEKRQIRTQSWPLMPGIRERKKTSICWPQFTGS
jgi:hypothetical protein